MGGELLRPQLAFVGALLVLGVLALNAGQRAATQGPDDPALRGTHRGAALLPPSHAAIDVLGRTVVEEGGRAFNWPGTAFTLTVDGATFVAIHMATDPGVIGRFVVEVNGLIKSPPLFVDGGADGSVPIVVASALTGRSTVRGEGLGWRAR